MAEKMITLGKASDLHTKRQVYAYITKETVTLEQIPAKSMAASMPEFPPPTTATCFPL